MTDSQPRAALIDGERAVVWTDGDGQVRALLTCAGNPVLSTPDGRAAALRMLAMPMGIAVFRALHRIPSDRFWFVPATCYETKGTFGCLLFMLVIRNARDHREHVHSRLWLKDLVPAVNI